MEALYRTFSGGRRPRPQERGKSRKNVETAAAGFEPAFAGRQDSRIARQSCRKIGSCSVPPDAPRDRGRTIRHRWATETGSGAVDQYLASRREGKNQKREWSG